MSKFRKKPVTIEAIQWDGTTDKAKEIVDFINKNGGDAQFINIEGLTSSISIATLEGDMQAVAKDWIIQGVKGEFYPCKPDIFAETYEQVIG